PTILAYLDLKIPQEVQGVSFKPLLERKAGTARKYVFGEYNSHGPSRAEHYPSRMVFDGKYYYIENLMPDKKYALPADLRMEKAWGNTTYSATVDSRFDHPVPYRLLRQLESGRQRAE